MFARINNRELLSNGYRISVRNNEKVLGKDGCGGCTIVRMT